MNDDEKKKIERIEIILMFLIGWAIGEILVKIKECIDRRY